MLPLMFWLFPATRDGICCGLERLGLMWIQVSQVGMVFFGAGGVLRDSEGVVLVTSFWPKTMVLGLGLADAFGLNNIQVFSDAICEVSKLNALAIPINEDEFIIEDIT